MRTFKWPVSATAAGVAGAWIYGGAAAAATVAILIAMEVSLSFDNAVVNAGILRRLSQAWQRAFLTVGIAFAVFGMRIVFPIAIVALATGDSMADVTHLALQAPDQYARRVEEAAPIIGAFGGMFLLSLSLRFLSAPARRRHWIGVLERPLQRLGATPGATIVVAGLGLAATARMVSPAHRWITVLAGLAGIVAFEVVHGVRRLVERRHHTDAPLGGAAGFAGFLFLETLDASFSLDGVLGAFALTSDVVTVGLGLGIGALYVRTLTVYLVRHEMLREFPYLGHGAHWAIGTLGVFLLVGIEREPPEWLTGSVSLGILAAAWLSSVRARNAPGASASSTPAAADR